MLLNHTVGKLNHRNFHIWSSCGQRGQMTIAIPDMAFSSAAICTSYAVEWTCLVTAEFLVLLCVQTKQRSIAECFT